MCRFTLHSDFIFKTILLTKKENNIHKTEKHLKRRIINNIVVIIYIIVVTI